MLPIIVTALADIVTSTIKSFLPETSEDKLEKIRLAIQQQAMQNDLLKGQLAINVEEAKNPNLFVAGWRPCVGWICTFGLAYNTVILALIKTIVALMVIIGLNPVTASQVQALMPAIDTGTLVSILASMVGIATVGTMRTVEKIKGVN